ncbi:MAG: glutamine--fructose-6-phosphate transaminase (isomerizing) [Legionellales bacterium]|nr:glutamine--fructose-6-phosphate transaminase (isomerizing) [Legionellales bacterium]
MCGIVGAIAQRDVANILVEGLKRLEYRGYDSAGIAILNHHQLQRIRAKGKVRNIEENLQKNFLAGSVGIAHTRWATHGEPNEGNAHPHISKNTLAVVHNGIIENHDALKKQLIQQGYQFESDTDTEVIAHLYHHAYQQSHDPMQAAFTTAESLHGAFALAILNSEEPEHIIAIRRGSPLVIGIGIDEHFLASDHLALLPVTQRFIFLEEGDIADIRRDGFTIYDLEGQVITRNVIESQLTQDESDRGKYRHFMEKEIYAQPEAILQTIEGRLNKQHIFPQIFGEQAESLFQAVRRVLIIACGTSYHAGMVARCWLESIAGIPCNVEIASEFRYRKAVIEEGTLLVCISQSGETADTLAALRASKQQPFLASLAICNVPESSLVREADLVFMTRAGREIGVASTKAFTTQLTALLMLTIVLGRKKNINETLEAELIQQLTSLPAAINHVLELNPQIEKIANHFADKHHALFLGRGVQYPIALEGALKLKEISYIHAEAYPAGELKHGPLALVDNDMPVVTVAPNDELLEKLKSNLQEVRARGGELYVFADHHANLSNGKGIHILEMPTVGYAIAPIVYTVPLQLLAYHAAVIKGTDVDQPRNLAKSVTVE